jgi:hypothetical protein
MTGRLLMCSFSSIAALVLSVEAVADPIRVPFTVTTTSGGSGIVIRQTLGVEFGQGDSFSGSFTFDSAAPDTAPGPQFGFFRPT